MQLAHDGLRFTQFLVEPRAPRHAPRLWMGQYSNRNGLSLIAIEGNGTLQKSCDIKASGEIDR
jgi:hypothetical protein